MCEPVSIGMAVASIGMSMYSANQQQKATRESAEVNMINAKNAQIADTNALREQSEQIASKAQDTKLARRREALKERSRMRVMNNGVNGNSVDRLFNTSYFNENFDNGTIEHNENNGQAQNLRDLEKVNVTGLGRQRNAETAWKSGGGSGRLLVSGLQGGLQGYSMASSMGYGYKPKVKTTKVKTTKVKTTKGE